MRLGINTLFLVPGDVGGTETYLRETLLALLAEYPGVEFVLFTNNENDALLKNVRRAQQGLICLPEFSCRHVPCGSFWSR